MGEGTDAVGRVLRLGKWTKQLERVFSEITYEVCAKI